MTDPRPAIEIPPVPHGEDEVFAFYGWDPARYILATGESAAAWERENIRMVLLPAPLRHVLNHRDGSPLFVTSIRVHRRLVDVFDATYRAIHALGPEHWTCLEPFAGAYVFRLIRDGVALSVHGLGGAADHGPQDNPMGHPDGKCARGDERTHGCRLGGTHEGRAVVAVFREHGFLWGGDFKRRKDCMHAQFARGY